MLCDYCLNPIGVVVRLKQTENGLFIEGEIDGQIYQYTVDFLSSKSEYRRLHGGGRGELIAKAIGVKGKDDLTVLDLTAGFARDAYVLACLGCKVTMIERSEIIYRLVDDAMQRAKDDDSFKNLCLKLVHADAKGFLKKMDEKDFPDVVYMDPMFPERKKSALVKKEMRILKAVVGDDDDADELLALALTKAKKRVVVKRPRYAESLKGPEPDVVFPGKSSRFDVYLQSGGQE